MLITRRFPSVLLITAVLWVTSLAPEVASQQAGASPQGGAQSAGGQDAGAPDAQGQQPTFRTTIDFVSVDVFVTDRNGQPISDLKQTDFEILEDGKPQAIDQFSAINIAIERPADEVVRAIRTPDDERREAERTDVRVFVFFLDDYHTRDRNAIAMRSTLTRFIETQLRPTDMVAVMYPLTPVNDVLFTRNHASIISAVSNFEGRKYDYTPRNQMERNYERASTDVIERMRNEVVATALEGLSIRLGGVREGRKTVIFVSEGFTVYLPPQMRRQNAQGPESLAPPVIDPRVEAMTEATNQLDLDNRMRDVYKAANRNNTSFYTLDPRGLAAFEFDINDGGLAGVPGQDLDQQAIRTSLATLRQLAEETDGRAIVNRNTLGEGLAQMVRDSSFYYLIGYTTQSPADGKFHEIRVRVKRPGASVRARRGYWAFTPADVKRITAVRSAPSAPNPAVQALASLATSSAQAARAVRTWVGTERGENGRTRVTLLWEPLPVQQGARREPAGRVSVLAADAQGGLVFRGRSPDSAGTSVRVGGSAPPAAPPASSAAGSTAHRLTFDAPPGKLELRLTIEAAGGGTLDTETRTIDVPDLTAPRAALSTPRVFRSRSARDFQLQAKDPTAVPVAAREFSRVERLLIRFDVYLPGSEAPSPAAVLLARDGKKIADLPVAPAAAGGSHQIDLGLNTLAAGEYVVEITVKDATGGGDTEYVPFRVGA